MKKFIAILLSLVLLFCCGCFPSVEKMPEGQLYAYFIDVGQADCALISLNGKNMLVDGGNAENAPLITKFIRNLGIKTIDIVIATHPHEDHIGALGTIIDNFNVGAVYSPVDTYSSVAFSEMKDAAQRQCGLSIIKAGTKLKLDTADISILWPAEIDKNNVNNTSIVFKLTYGNTAFLFTGDAESDVETKIVESGYNLTADVLKVGHHGSSTSTSYLFLRSVSPTHAIISCGKDNSYGHPHKETIEILSQAEIETYRTDMLGTITVISDGINVTVKTDSSPDIEATSLPENYYIGNANSKKFHLPTCGGLPQENNRKIFYSRQDAVDSGYVPCGICKP